MCCESLRELCDHDHEDEVEEELEERNAAVGRAILEPGRGAPEPPGGAHPLGALTHGGHRRRRGTVRSRSAPCLKPDQVGTRERASDLLERTARREPAEVDRGEARVLE